MKNTTVTMPTFYNVFRLDNSGDKYLIAQTTTPKEFVEMEYPAIPISSEEEDGSIFWSDQDENSNKPELVAVPMHPVRLEVLMPETEYNRVRGW